MALCATACGDASPEVDRSDEPVSALEQQIVNGSNADGDLGVVALTTGGQAFCTGTLITPTVVLTAAHCLPPHLGDFGVFDYDQIEIFFGSDVQGSGDFIDVVSGWTHPGWNLDLYEHDIGLVRLAQPGPATPIPYATTTMSTIDVGAPTRLVGFGITGEGNGDSGRKRQGSSNVDEVFQYVFTMGLDPSVTCSGDSGGPTLMWRNGGEAVVGVHSRSDCVSQSIDTRVDDYGPEIDAFLGNGPVGPQCYEDGQCASGCGTADPDCPCAADGFCTAACFDQTTDPDCMAESCAVDDVCNPECIDTPDPDCGGEAPPPEGSSNGWVAGDADEADYDGNVIGSCAHAPRQVPDRGLWLLVLAGLAGALGRRRRAR